MKSNKGITLIALVVTTVILIIIAAVAVTQITGSDGFLVTIGEGTENANLKFAKEDMERKIHPAQIILYGEKDITTSIQDLTDILSNDNEVEYIEASSKKVERVEIYEDINEDQAVFVKLKKYPYEFMISNSLKIVAIDGKGLYEPDNTSDSTINIFIDDIKKKNIPDKDSDYIFTYYETNSETALLEFDNTNWCMNVYNLRDVSTMFNVYFYEKDRLDVLLKLLGIEEEYETAEKLYTDQYVQVLENKIAVNYIVNSSGELLSEFDDFLTAVSKSQYLASVDGNNNTSLTLSPGIYCMQVTFNTVSNVVSFTAAGKVLQPVRDNLYCFKIDTKTNGNVAIKWYSNHYGVYKYMYTQGVKASNLISPSTECKKIIDLVDSKIPNIMLNLYVDGNKVQNIGEKFSNLYYGHYNSKNATTLKFDEAKWILNAYNITSNINSIDVHFYTKDNLSSLLRILALSNYEDAESLYADKSNEILSNYDALRYISASGGELANKLLPYLTTATTVTSQASVDGTNTYTTTLAPGNYYMKFSCNVTFSISSFVADGVTLTDVGNNQYIFTIVNNTSKNVTVKWYCYKYGTVKKLSISYRCINSR